MEKENGKSCTDERKCPPCFSGQGDCENLTFGEKAVGLTFNPSNNASVDNYKRCFADIIDMLDEDRRRATNDEVKRMASVAITEAQTAQMWAVKALTWRG